MQNLVEKQRIFAALYETVMEQETPHKGLLLRGDSSDLQQGEMLLRGAIYEGTSSGRKSCFPQFFVKRKLSFFSLLVCSGKSAEPALLKNKRPKPYR